MSVQTLIQIRRGSYSEWFSANPTLSAGEWGYETDSGRYKIGNGLTAWNSLSYTSLLPKSSDIVGTSGIGISFASVTGVPVIISVTGIVSSQITNFNSAVNALINSAAVSSGQVMDIVSSGLVEGNNIDLSYNTGNNTLTISVTGLTIGTHVQAYDAGLQSIAGLTTGSDNYLYTTGSDTYTTGIITSFGRSLVDDTDASAARTTLGLGTISTFNSGDYSLAGHTHVWSNITDASTKATLNELAYLSGVSAGTASANRVIVLDSNKDITGIGNLTTTGNITIGGDLIVNGTTTTVNSTTVDIGDNIVRVNTSGLNTGGFEVYTGTDYKQLVWNVSNNRWEFTGGNIYTSGNFIGNLSGNATTVTNGVYITDTGTVTSTMIANNTIVDADINSSAGIVYSKLSLTSGIVDSDISGSAGIVDTKLATISTSGKVSNSATTATSSNTASAIVARDSSGNFTANVITASGFVGSGNLLTNLDASNISTGTLDVARLPTGIPVTNLASSGVTIGSTTVNLGQTTSVLNGLSSISGTSALNPTTLYYCVIDGGSP